MMEQTATEAGYQGVWDLERLMKTYRLLAVVGWLLLHRIVINRGFVLRRRGLSTDTRISLLIGILSTQWFVSVLLHVRNSSWKDAEGKVSWDHIGHSLVRLNQAPLLVQILFIFWNVSWIDGLRADKDNRRKPNLWSLVHLRGPFDWASGIHRGYYWTLIIVLCLTIAIPAIASIIYAEPFDGILALSGLLIFLLNGTTNNPYTRVMHRYADDQLRIALPTSHHEGTMYVLPSRGNGIDAVWTPKIEAENVEADQEIMVLFQQMRSGRWSVSQPLERLRKALVAYQRRVLLSIEQAELLAEWIYAERPGSDAAVKTIQCFRAQDVHLIGRDLMYALCHAEYLVFMAQPRLKGSTQSKLGSLRLMSRSGAGNDGSESAHTIGFLAGFAGYKEAVEHVYSMFNLEVEEKALEFASSQPPHYSAALARSPSSIDDYVAQLWDLSIQNTESTFSALYFFCTVWFMEMGNVNGFHIFPLRCKTKDGDLISQQIAWRQAWYAGLIAQLVTTGPSLFMMYFVGYLE